MQHCTSTRKTVLTPIFPVLLAGLLLGAMTSPAHAQRAGDTFYGKLGVGASDYTGDFPAQNAGHPFDFQEFTRGSGIPFVVAGEVGYQFSRKWALALGFQGGNYPIVGYSGGPSGIEDSYRYTPQLLGRYTFGSLRRKVAPYIDLGVNATFGGDASVTSTGVGPSVGGGVDVLLSRSLSFYVESRFNMTLPDDAVDGSSAGGPFDLTNQLLGFGLKVNFTSPTAPRIIGLDGPTTAQVGQSVRFGATVNEGEADHPLTYQWDFGDGDTGSSLTTGHTYDRPGTYTVAFSASNAGGDARESMTVKVKPPPSPSSMSEEARIASITVTPSPAVAGTPVKFESAVEGGSAPTYKWRFGDGTTATGASATHTYENPGRYTAQLDISNDAGTDARTVTLRVDPRMSEASGGSSGSEGRQESKTGQESVRWGVVVASMRNDGGAETAAQRYQDRFAESMPVDVVAANTDQGLRYRVVVGAFEDRDAARQAIDEHGEDLPDGAWPLRLR
jgi:PKD repeat protein